MSEYQILNVKTDSFETDYIKFGRGKKPFVIIPGLSLKSVIGSAAAVADAYKDFANDYTVYVIDRRKDLPKGSGIIDMADDTANVMKALGIEEAYIFATSQGGMIAQYVAINYPKLVKKLVLGSSASKIYDEAKKVLTDWSAFAKAGEIDALCRDFVKRLYSKPFAEKYGELIVKMNADASNEEIDRFLTSCDSFEGFDVTGELNKIMCPTLVIGSEEDCVLTPAASYETARILGCDIYMYGDGYQHAVYDEAPDYKERLLNFFSE